MKCPHVIPYWVVTLRPLCALCEPMQSPGRHTMTPMRRRKREYDVGSMKLEV